MYVVESQTEKGVKEKNKYQKNATIKVLLGWRVKGQFLTNWKTLTIFDDFEKRGFSAHITVLAIFWILGGFQKTKKHYEIDNL